LKKRRALDSNTSERDGTELVLLFVDRLFVVELELSKAVLIIESPEYLRLDYRAALVL
jgi:hypothetical protein